MDKVFEWINKDTGLFIEHDNRGEAPSVHKSSDEVIANINAHIAKFPTIEFHCCRYKAKWINYNIVFNINFF